MMRRTFTEKGIQVYIFLMLLVFGVGENSIAQSSDTDKKPNVILIYIDDMGYSDISDYGDDYGQDLIETPNMDQLIKEGKKFTNAYSSAPICSPSRAALLTGKTPARLNFEFVTKNETEDYSWDDQEWVEKFSGRKLIPPPYTLNLPLEEITLAEALNEAGYTTGIVGKWHVAAHYQHYKGWSLTHGPEQQGFDYVAETFGSHPYADRFAQPLDIDDEYEKGEYPEDELTNKAIEFLQQDHEEPFFLFTSHYFVHDPFETKVEWLIEKYRNKAGPNKSEDRIIYAAMMETLDYYVGQLLKAVESSGLFDNTIIILTSDNGGHPGVSYNRPFRGSKWNLYEGGIRVPMIVRWPGVVEAGSISGAPVSQVDFMPTLREIAGLENNFERELDGLSLVPLLRGEKIDKYYNRDLIWHFPYYHPEGQAYDRVESEIGIEDGYVSKTTPQSAIRKDNLKLIYFYDEDRAELYDLSKDPSEQHDLSSVRPWDTELLKDHLLEKLHEKNARFPRVNN